VKIKLPFHYKYIKKLLDWANQQPYFCYFNPQQTDGYPYGSFDHQLVIGKKPISLNTENYFSSLQYYLQDNPEQSLFGYFSYDLKNQLEKLKSANDEGIRWDLCGFFKPECIIHISENYLEIEASQARQYKSEIEALLLDDTHAVPKLNAPIIITASTSQEEYIQTVLKLKNHIIEGDIYEINYCINFSVSTSFFNPIDNFLKLCDHSPTPFASLLKWNSKYILCASPERFIKMKNDKVISQPIKGTAKRSEDKLNDELAKSILLTSEKERAENMMIVDLVRNDLAKSSLAGTVTVEELFGIYSFKHVHQMISTVTSMKKASVSSVETIKNAFPMGSMTGAPKIRAMQLIEQYETTKRGAFSGSIGYFKGAEEFDFNVVIRSLFYDQKNGVVNYQVGSAITHDCDPEEEYQECLLKAHAIEQVLKQ
jgi:para-aminobenzoate synthetase component 1